MAKEPKKFVIRKIPKKSGGTYDRKVLSEEWKKWRNEEAKRNRDRAKYFEKRKELIKKCRKVWKRASKWDTKTEQMIYWKDIMTFKEYVEMRLKSHDINEPI